MYKPDHVIVRKIREYDPCLFLTWNEKGAYFELWRDMRETDAGPRMITPVTMSIYESGAPKAFTPVDERILWWIYGADGWRKEKNSGLEEDRRFLEFQAKQRSTWNQDLRHKAKEYWHTANNFFSNRYTSRNTGRPTQGAKQHAQKWIAPDSAHGMSERMFSRSAANARAYDYKRPA